MTEVKEVRLVKAESVMDCRLSVKQGEKMNAREAMGWTNSINEVLGHSFTLDVEQVAKVIFEAETKTFETRGLEMRGIKYEILWGNIPEGIKKNYRSQARAVLALIEKGGKE